jgi:hypothetical protein
MHWAALAPLLLMALAIMGTPGPATISLTAVGSSFGLRRSLPYLVDDQRRPRRHARRGQAYAVAP